QLFDFLALLADDHAHPGRVDEDHHLFPRPLDLHPADGGLAVVLLDVAAHPVVLDQQLGEVLLAGVPPALPVGHDPGTETARPDFLTHASLDPWPRPQTASQARPY